MPRERASELEYLTWFRCNADFGPGDFDAKYFLNERFKKETGKLLPANWDDSVEEIDNSQE